MNTLANLPFTTINPAEKLALFCAKLQEAGFDVQSSHEVNRIFNNNTPLVVAYSLSANLVTFYPPIGIEKLATRYRCIKLFKRTAEQFGYRLSGVGYLLCWVSAEPSAD